MIIVQTFCMCLCSGRMTELHFRILFGCLNHVILMTKGICKDNSTSGIHHLFSRIKTFLAFRDIGLDNIILLADAEFFTGFFSAIDEVQVIG